jgi:Tannase and feruloyl esterase
MTGRIRYGSRPPEDPTWRNPQPTDPDLAAFRQRGEKLLMYHGWAEPATSAYGTIAYYEQVVPKAGGKPAANRFVRLFLAPRMHKLGAGRDRTRSRA